MKLLTGCLVLAILGASSGADAFSWRFWERNRKPSLPKPIDSPIVRPKQQAEKAVRQKHPSKYLRQDWGQEKGVYDVRRPREGNHSLFRD